LNFRYGFLFLWIMWTGQEPYRFDQATRLMAKIRRECRKKAMTLV